MSKKRFIQSVMARSLPTQDKRQAALAYAEGLWDWLCKQGYGADQPAQPRAAKNWLAELSGEQAAAFRRFWTAYNYKRGVQRAAMRWQQLGDMTAGQYQAIIDAAAKEAGKQLPPGQARKMAEGWLFERRWEDAAKAPADKGRERMAEINALHNDIIGLTRLYELSKDPGLKAQIDLKQQQFNALRGDHHATPQQTSNL